jgi:hypothetical protein
MTIIQYLSRTCRHLKIVKASQDAIDMPGRKKHIIYIAIQDKKGTSRLPPSKNHVLRVFKN